MEKRTIIFLVLLNTNSLAPAQTSLIEGGQNEMGFYKGIDMSVAASGDNIKYAVLMNGQFDLGFYYSFGNSKIVKFRICGSETTQDVQMDQLQETTENCRSLPGEPIKPLTNSAQWRYDGERNSYFVVLDGIKAGQVPCAKTPISVIKAAQHGIAEKSGLVATKNSKLAKSIASEWSISNIDYVGDGSVPEASDCAAAPEFWTTPISGLSASPGFLAVTAKEPVKSGR
ncbi:hypothetical protein HB779_07895 [Phyllobacterium sp. 628]|uniref:hypothetical protein n=1 Tax=Phyllobacterium sp. 628 TaxID=2718938 RepID=UPI0016622442|nr:hypothetical protein [Phyllobacterium sp. 628]QND51831.1 hypothetical protein HB779_07895 [Phyllobacterium sp. 628]